MKFTQKPAAVVEKQIAGRIGDKLSNGKRVLWLVSGGSNVAIEVAVMRQLHALRDGTLPHLTILPMDERYGPSGHRDSNAEQLRRAGFDPGTAHWTDILTQNVNFEATVRFYSEVAADAFAQAQVIIGQFGMGADGHVAGILPGSPACIDDSATVVGYNWQDYTRLTLSARALEQITTGYVVAYGESKRLALERLRRNEEPFERLPAKLLYDIPEVYVYTDVNDIGEASGTRQ